MNINPLHHCSISQLTEYFEEPVKKIMAATIDMTDNLIVQAITQAAKDDGVTDIYLIDKKFAAEALREKMERENPKPLTIEELKQMKGEPVWLVWPDGRIQSKWWLVGDYDWLGMEFDDPITEQNYGKTWIAYCHKPKEA